MYRTHRALAALVLGLALVGATAAVAAADPATGTQQQQTDQRKALYQSELERNLATAGAAGAAAGQPAATTDPASSRPGLDGLPTLLIGLVAGLLVGAAAVLAWTTPTGAGPGRPPASEPPLVSSPQHPPQDLEPMGHPDHRPRVLRRYLLNPAVNPLRSWRRPMT